MAAESFIVTVRMECGFLAALFDASAETAGSSAAAWRAARSFGRAYKGMVLAFSRGRWDGPGFDPCLPA